MQFATITIAFCSVYSAGFFKTSVNFDFSVCLLLILSRALIYSSAFALKEC